MLLKLITTLLLLAVYYVAYLSSATTQLGIQMTDLNSIFPFDVMPPGVSFMIAWSLIYGLLGLVTIMIWQKSFDIDKNKYFLTLLIVSHIFHIGRLITNGQELFILNIVIIFLLWVSLGKMLDYLKLEKSNAASNLRRITIGTYYGWVSMATWVLGVSQLMYLWMPSFTLSSTWSIIAMGLGVIVTVLSWLRWKNPYVLLLCLWGLGGVLFGVLS